MKQTLWLTILAVAAITWVPSAWAQTNPRGQAALPGGAVSVDYGRPSAKGRDVLGMIEPGATWRMGADSATQLTSKRDIEMGGKVVPSGTYTLVAHFAQKDQWALRVTDGDGKTLAEAPGKLEKGRPLVEVMTIDLKNNADAAELALTWGTYRLTAPFKVK